MAPLPFLQTRAIFQCACRVAKPIKIPMGLVLYPGVPGLAPPYLVNKSPIDYHELKNLEADDGQPLYASRVAL